MDSPASEPQQTSPARVSRTSEDWLRIPEGAIYWRLDVSAESEEMNRPTILLIHAAVADHTMWDAQVDFLVSKGWNCLRWDMFGYGKSWPSEDYLRSQTRNPFDPVEQIERLRQTVLGPDSNVIVIGLSIGASLALAYALARPEYVNGIALIAGGLRGFEYNNDPREDALFEHSDSLAQIGDVHGVANLMVRIWGDGPLQDPGRLKDDVADRMLKWNIDIAARECAKSGGMELDAIQQDPPPIARLHTIEVPTTVAWGTFDESYTTAAMKYVADKVREATYREFETAHMINLEKPDEVNQWLSEWLEESFES